MRQFLLALITLIFMVYATTATHQPTEDDGSQLILDAILDNDLDALRVYISHNTPLDSSKHGQNPLEFALIQGNNEAVHILLDNKADPSFVTEAHRDKLSEITGSPFWLSQLLHHWPVKSPNYITRSSVKWLDYLKEPSSYESGVAKPAATFVSMGKLVRSHRDALVSRVGNMFSLWKSAPSSSDLVILKIKREAALAEFEAAAKRNWASSRHQ